MTTLGLKNVNMLTKEQYDGVTEPVKDELWAVEVKTYSDDEGNWYRIYPDGWIEQGGNIYLKKDASSTITLLKPFSDTNATVTACSYHDGTHDSNYMNSVSCYFVSNNQLKISHLSESNNYRWYACGY